jgi:hypothetical protein
MADDDEADAKPSAAEPASSEEGPSTADAAAPVTDAASTDKAPAKAAPRARRAIPWWSFVLAALVIEFYVYGRTGHIEVCVGKKGETDFSLVGDQRTDENRWKFPRCESRLNLGLVSHADQLTKEATLVACRGATIFRHQGEGKACTEGKAGWEQRIEAHQCPPWHGHFYEHLFWFLK